MNGRWTEEQLTWAFAFCGVDPGQATSADTQPPPDTDPDLGPRPTSGPAPPEGNKKKDQPTRAPAETPPKSDTGKARPHGPLSEADYKAWLKDHPKAQKERVGPWLPPKMLERYTPEYFRAKGFFLSGKMNMGGGGYDEVWLNDTGDGTEYRVYRGPDWPKPEQPPEQPPEDPCKEIKRKLKGITTRLDKAMMTFEAVVERLEKAPSGADRTGIEQEAQESRSTVRSIVDELAKLQDEAEEVDEQCADLVSEDWTFAMEEFTTLLQRLNGAKSTGAAP